MRRRENELWKELRAWFTHRGWNPLEFQEETWKAMRGGSSGILHMPTGAGKTYAVYFPAVIEAAASGTKGLHVLYITPLRALSRDIEKALKAPVEELGWNLRVESRTGDTSASTRRKQQKSKPHVLVTTPESLALLLSYPSAEEDFKHVRTVIVDEWHELISTKRGSLLELSLTRLRRWAPRCRTWAVSATLANVEEAARAAVGKDAEPVIVSTPLDRDIEIVSVLPDTIDKFPWAGHIGLKMLPKVITAISFQHSTLLFTNTRSQAERWHQAILLSKPEWEPLVGLHHGSIDRKRREAVEEGVKEGRLKLVIATSSLDLGVDLAPVEQVIQVGSAKGIARLVQRAGRAGHAPGKRCQILFVPTHALELIEIAAARDSIRAGDVERRRPIEKPLDVLAQHLVTCALGGGFVREQALEEARRAFGFRDLSEQEMDWTLALVKNGGGTLSAYPNYHKIEEVDGRYVVTVPAIARQHRQNIGTITSDGVIVVKFLKGGKLGTIEEAYLAKLRKGDKFIFAGKLLELVMIRDMVAYVRRAKGDVSQTPSWNGGRFPLSASLSRAMRRKLSSVREAFRISSEPPVLMEPELLKVMPILRTQAALSAIPGDDEILAETTTTRDGVHLFLFPFEGQLVHDGLASLLAYRMSRVRPVTFTLTVNDYGIEFLTADKEFPFDAVLVQEIFSEVNIVEDILTSVNLSELARRQFREIARVAGLVSQNHAGSAKTTRQLQASSSLLFDVFERYDPENLLLKQARREVLEQQFEQARLLQVLRRFQTTPLKWMTPPHPTPLAFPLVAARIGTRVFSTESLEARIARMVMGWSKTETKSLLAENALS